MMPDPNQVEGERPNQGDPSRQPRLGRAAQAATLLSVIMSLLLLPVALTKPGRLLTNAAGELIINPVSFSGLGVILAADVAFVLGVHLWISLVRPTKALLPISTGLAIEGACGIAMGAFGVWLLVEPWQPEPDSGVMVPRSLPTDLAGLAVTAIALGTLCCFRKTYSDYWRRTAERRPNPERPQGLGERLRNGFFMGLVAGTIVGALVGVGIVVTAHLVGVPQAYKGHIFVWVGIAVSILVQCYMVGAGLRGRITRGRGMPFRG